MKKENVLVEKTSKILQKNTKGMHMVDIIADLVEVIEKQENMMKIFIMEDEDDAIG